MRQLLSSMCLSWSTIGVGPTPRCYCYRHEDVEQDLARLVVAAEKSTIFLFCFEFFASDEIRMKLKAGLLKMRQTLTLRDDEDGERVGAG